MKVKKKATCARYALGSLDTASVSPGIIAQLSAPGSG